VSDLKVTVVIPALNEEETIGRVLIGVKKHVDEIILVDDASNDRTGEVAQQEGAVILRHEQNCGYDKSIDDGFALAKERGAQIVMTFDADGQHNSDDIPMILEPILKGDADVVVGKRPFRARITEHLFAFVARRKADIEDPLCGLKAYRIEVYNDIGFFDNISSIGTQLMFNAKRKGYRICQRAISLERRTDVPRFGRSLKANWKIFKAIMKITFFKGVLV